MRDLNLQIYRLDVHHSWCTSLPRYTNPDVQWCSISPVLWGVHSEVLSLLYSEVFVFCGIFSSIFSPVYVMYTVMYHFSLPDFIHARPQQPCWQLQLHHTLTARHAQPAQLVTLACVGSYSLTHCHQLSATATSQLLATTRVSGWLGSPPHTHTHTHSQADHL